MIRRCSLAWLVLALALTAMTPTFADSFLIYTEGGLPAAVPGSTTELWTWCDQGQPCADTLEVCGSPEGSRTLRSSVVQPPATFGPASPGPPDVLAEPQQLPIVSDSVDVVVLPHVLEFRPPPHDALRAYRRGRLDALVLGPYLLTQQA